MDCEVCGKTILGKPHRAVISGARLIVCAECARLSSSSWKPTPYQPPLTMRPTAVRRPSVVRPRPLSPVPEELEIVDDYAQRIRKAREGLNLNHEELGRKVSERVSVLQKLETGKMVPTQALARKLEYALKIKLLKPQSSRSEDKELLAKKPVELTLGDVVTFKKRENPEGEEERER